MGGAYSGLPNVQQESLEDSTAEGTDESER